jgi:hypothetical protein
MRKRISIDQLKIGMQVEKLDRSWPATPFLRHRFTITSSEQIEQLHAINQFGLIAAIVDIYDAVTSDRCYHKGKTPHDTLQFLYQLGTRGHVDGALVRQFVQVVGVYPVGSCLSLNTGETAIVKHFNHHAPIRPLVVLITDQAGHRRSTPVDLDRAAQLRRPERTIASILDPIVLGINPCIHLDSPSPHTP